MKLAFHEYFEATGLELADLPYLHYMTERLETVKFIKWLESLTQDIVNNYDDKLAR